MPLSQANGHWTQKIFPSHPDLGAMSGAPVFLSFRGGILVKVGDYLLQYLASYNRFDIILYRNAN